SRVRLVWVEAEEIGENPARHLSSVQGILVPGGFGSRGLAGKIKAIQYAREENTFSRNMFGDALCYC
ncbi:hypothetical protein LCGC14_2051090, partial [marine sediment metagenome]